MPVPIVTRIGFNPDGADIKVELSFQTILLCTYKIDLREKESNSSVNPFPTRGDNTNSEDDAYSLPTPVSANDGRSLWAFLTIIDQTGEGGSYECKMILSQNGKVIGECTTGKKEIDGNSSVQILVAKLSSGGSI